jgi:hypothetical protein
MEFIGAKDAGEILIYQWISIYYHSLKVLSAYE